VTSDERRTRSDVLHTERPRLIGQWLRLREYATGNSSGAPVPAWEAPLDHEVGRPVTAAGPRAT
jgi:hypothetical protein